MVYYGTPSKGCERCRRRKVKCDQQVPGCLKCRKSGFQCPGYRNLLDVMFRDESKRIARKVVKQISAASWPEADGIDEIRNYSVKQLPAMHRAIVPSRDWVPRPRTLSFAENDLAANFFFAHFTHNEPPFADQYNSWLIRSFSESGNILRVAIEAIGLAGISNVSYSPEFESKSRERYGKVLTDVKRDLGCHEGATSDTTLMAIILLSFYEELNLESHAQSGYEYWSTHVKGATALLELRGKDQFAGQRGGLLYLLLRSQIVSIFWEAILGQISMLIVEQLTYCLKQNKPVPYSLVVASSTFQSSSIRENWKTRQVASAGSLCEISFRVVNLRADFRNGRIDYCATRDKVQDINNDLQTWREAMPAVWKYSTEPAPDGLDHTVFGGVIHSYSSMWVAEAWNSWRLLRILVNQLMQENEMRAETPNTIRRLLAEAMIRHTSHDLCVSVNSFRKTPRIISMVWPLFIISKLQVNDKKLRTFATDEVRRIGTTVGSRQACIFADIASGLLKESSQQDIEAPAGDSQMETYLEYLPLGIIH